jgi:hypothetical protein
MAKITYDNATGQIVAFVGPLKVAVITTHHYQGLVKNGVPVFESLPREAWTIHFTSPVMDLDVLESLVKSLPQG